jgi:hypothetical protein
VALDFQGLRDRAPWMFLSPAFNKFLYGLLGLRDLFVRSCKDLPDKVELWCDGRLVQLPPHTESFIILNINSHAGGCELWPDPTPADLSGTGNGNDPSLLNLTSSRFDDGLLEVVATTGVLHLGRIRVGLGQPIRIAQARHIRIRTKSFLPGQVDGEPWRLPRCEMTLEPSGQAFVLQHLSKVSLVGVEGGRRMVADRAGMGCQWQELLQYTDFLVQQGKLDPAMKDQLLEAFKRKGGNDEGVPAAWGA